MHLNQLERFGWLHIAQPHRKCEGQKREVKCRIDRSIAVSNRPQLWSSQSRAHWSDKSNPMSMEGWKWHHLDLSLFRRNTHLFLNFHAIPLSLHVYQMKGARMVSLTRARSQLCIGRMLAFEDQQFSGSQSLQPKLKGYVEKQTRKGSNTQYWCSW